MLGTSVREKYLGPHADADLMSVSYFLNKDLIINSMNGISMPLDYSSSFIIHWQLTSALPILSLIFPLERELSAVSTLGLHMCVYSFARLPQIVFARAEFFIPSNSLFYPTEFVNSFHTFIISLFQTWLQLIAVFKWFSWVDKLTDVSV